MSMRVGVLTGGGDAPGLNAAICGLGRRLLEANAELIGFADGSQSSDSFYLFGEALRGLDGKTLRCSISS